MTAIIIPSRRLRQPTGLVRINWSNPLTKGLFAALSGHQPLVNVVEDGPKVAVYGNGMSPKAYAEGLGMSGNATDYIRLDFDANLWGPAEISYLWQAGYGTTANQGWGWFGDSGSNFEHVPYSGSIYLSCGTNTRPVVKAPAQPLTGPLKWISTLQGGVTNGFKFYENGVNTVTSTQTMAFRFSAYPMAYVSLCNGYTPGYTGVIFQFAMWKRALLEAEVYELNAYPWSLFAPDVRRLYFVPAAAAGGTTVSPPVGSATYTGLAPAVAATANHQISVPVGAATYAGLAPSATVSGNVAISVPVGSAVYSGLAPTATRTDNIVVVPPVGAAAFAGLAPSVGVGYNVAIPAGAATFAGLAPSLSVTEHVQIAVPVGSVAYTGLAPTAASSDIWTPKTGASTSWTDTPATSTTWTPT